MERRLRAWAVMFVLAMVAWACWTYWPEIRNEVFVLMGNRNEAGGYYGFWSGFAGGLRIIEWPVLAGLLYWHQTCQHSKWCLRWGKYPAAGGMFKMCYKHHPDLGERPGHELIHRLHRERT